MAHRHPSSSKCVFVFDTETTGFLKSRPYLVSIAYQVYAVHSYQDEGTTGDGEKKIILLHKAYYIIKPPTDTYEIPPESTNVHKITTEIARTYGITYKTLVTQLRKVFNTFNIDTMVAHNIKFDIGVLSINLDRLRTTNQEAVALLDKIGNIEIYCTQEEGTPITKLEFKNNRYTTSNHRSSSSTPAVKKYKYPKLCELYSHYFEDKFDEHCAESDTMACARCYFKMVYDIDINKST